LHILEVIFPTLLEHVGVISGFVGVIVILNIVRVLRLLCLLRTLLLFRPLRIVRLVVFVHELGGLDYLVGNVATSAALRIGWRPTRGFLASPLPARPPILPTTVLISSLVICLRRECTGSQGRIGCRPIGAGAARLEALDSVVGTSQPGGSKFLLRLRRRGVCHGPPDPKPRE
jgi:hypothetical protein